MLPGKNTHKQRERDKRRDDDKGETCQEWRKIFNQIGSRHRTEPHQQRKPAAMRIRPNWQTWGKRLKCGLHENKKSHWSIERDWSRCRDVGERKGRWAFETEIHVKVKAKLPFSIVKKRELSNAINHFWFWLAKSQMNYLRDVEVH